MADVFSKEKRSEVMRLVKSSNTKPEMTVRRFLHKFGFRYRVNDKKLPGRPDIKLTKYKTVIFINGCFWHGHNKKCGYLMPKTNKKFWNNKINNNVVRDIRNIEKLKSIGWKVIVIWECELKKKNLQSTLIKLVDNIQI